MNIQRFLLAVVFGAILLPGMAGASPHERHGFFLGLGLGRGSMAQTFEGQSSDRVSGTGGTFRLGWMINPKFALGIENNSCFTSDPEAIEALGTSTMAVSFFPYQGLVVRGGLGAGYAGAAGDGLGGDAGFGWTAGTAYEFRAGPHFAIGPQIDYAHMSFTYVENNFVNVGLSMNWYFGSN